MTTNGGGVPNADWTLGEAQAWLRDRVEKGAKCPCCTQFAKAYPRSLPSASCVVMIELYKAGGGDKFHSLPDLLERHVPSRTAHQGGYGTLAHHWGLIEALPGKREDGSNRVGYWRLTADGRDFVEGTLLVPKKARIYANRLLGFVGPDVSIREQLRDPFDYDELMGRGGDG